MKAVILSTGKVENLKPLNFFTPEFLLPIVNKPIVEHLIELLVRNNVKDIIIILKHMPYETEKYFGDGERWGANLSYYLEREFCNIGTSLVRILSKLDESFLCLSGNTVLNLDIMGLVKAHNESNGDMTISKQTYGDNCPVLSSLEYVRDDEEFSPFIMTKQALSRILTDNANQDMKQIMCSAIKRKLHLSKYCTLHDFSVVNSIREYWEINKRILKGDFSGIIISGEQKEKGIWLGRHTRIHHTVKMEAPLLIGNNCNILQGAIIRRESIVSDNVVIEKNVSTEKSIILENTYVGSNIEIKDSVVRKNYIVNVPRGINTFVGDNFIIGDIEHKFISEKAQRLFNLFFSLIFFMFALPVLIILWLCNLLFSSEKYFYSEDRFGQNEVVDLHGNMKARSFKLYTLRSKNHFLKKLPGLINVIKGDMNLVGNTPLTKKQISTLKEEWENLRFNVPAGLFHLWEVEAKEEITDEEKIVMENYYATTRSFWGDIKILLRSLNQYGSLKVK